MPTKSLHQTLGDVDSLASDKVRLAELEAEKDLAVNAVLSKHAPEIDSLKAKIKRANGRLRNWLTNNSALIFRNSPTGTGATTTTVANLAWKKTPDSIVPIDRKASQESLVNLLLQKGFDEAVRTVSEPDREYLAKLTDEELESVGFKRSSSYSLKVEPLAKSNRRAS